MADINMTICYMHLVIFFCLVFCQEAVLPFSLTIFIAQNTLKFSE